MCSLLDACWDFTTVHNGRKPQMMEVRVTSSCLGCVGCSWGTQLYFPLLLSVPLSPSSLSLVSGDTAQVLSSSFFVQTTLESASGSNCSHQLGMFSRGVLDLRLVQPSSLFLLISQGPRQMLAYSHSGIAAGGLCYFSSLVFPFAMFHCWSCCLPQASYLVRR